MEYTEDNDTSGISEGPRLDLYCFPLQPNNKSQCRYTCELDIKEAEAPSLYSIKKNLKQPAKSRAKANKSPLQQSTVKNEGEIQRPDAFTVRLRFAEEKEEEKENRIMTASTNVTKQSMKKITSEHKKQVLVQKLLDELMLKRKHYAQDIEYMESLKLQLESRRGEIVSNLRRKQNILVDRIKAKTQEMEKQLDYDVFARLKTIHNEIDKQLTKVSTIDGLTSNLKTALLGSSEEAKKVLVSLKDFLNEPSSTNQYEEQDFPSSFANLVEPAFPFEIIENSEGGRNTGIKLVPSHITELVKYKDTFSTYDNRTISNNNQELKAGDTLKSSSERQSMEKSKSLMRIQSFIMAEDNCSITLKGPFEGLCQFSSVNSPNTLPVYVVLGGKNSRKFYYLATLDEKATGQHLFDIMMTTLSIEENTSEKFVLMYQESDDKDETELQLEENIVVSAAKQRETGFYPRINLKLKKYVL